MIDIDVYKKVESTVDCLHGSTITHLFVVLEDEPYLVLDLDKGYIYFELLEINGYIRLTTHFYDSKIIKRSEVRQVFHNLDEVARNIYQRCFTHTKM